MFGKIITATITDMNKDAFFVQKDGHTFTLEKNDLADDRIYDRGDEVTGFVYEDKNHTSRMTQHYPRAMVDQYGWGVVTETRRDLGVFVDIGLNDKDVVVSLDDLPLDRFKWPKIGDRLLVSLTLDHKDRIWAQMADDEVFQQLASRYPNNLKNKELKVTVYASRFVGAFAISDEYYLTFIHESQMYQPPRLGEVLTARVIGGGEHGRLNLSTLPQAYEVIDDDAQMILMMLKRTATKTLPYADSSSADDIKDHFGISKSSFKRAIGNLLKNKLIVQDKAKPEIKLIEAEEADKTEE